MHAPVSDGGYLAGAARAMMVVDLARVRRRVSLVMQQVPAAGAVVVLEQIWV